MKLIYVSKSKMAANIWKYCHVSSKWPIVSMCSAGALPHQWYCRLEQVAGCDGKFGNIQRH